MVEVLRKKTTAEVLNTLGRERPLRDRLEALEGCCLDDLNALYGYKPQITKKPVELPNLHPFPTAA